MAAKTAILAPQNARGSADPSRQDYVGPPIDGNERWNFELVGHTQAIKRWDEQGLQAVGGGSSFQLAGPWNQSETKRAIMGRPYAAELDELTRTYDWAIGTCVDDLAECIAVSTQGPLLAVGSGGSLTAAHFACLLHTEFTGRFAQVVTPYELVSSPLSLEDFAVLILSAGGSNPDVLACVDDVAARVPHQLAAITMTLGSPLSDRFLELSWPTVHAFEPPTRKDGFLATNSLLATLVVLARAYAIAVDVPVSLPATFDLLAHPGQSWREFVESWTPTVSPLLQRQTLVVLHGGDTKTTAADIESRFTEAALGSVQVADFRNFAHGRHYWLAVNAATSAVLALSSPPDRQIANRTLGLLPKETPRLQLESGGTISAVLASICPSMYLAYIAGNMKHVDPGRPHVPMFGRKLYHLKAKPRALADMAIDERMRAAIQRKSGYSCRNLIARGELDTWVEFYGKFLETLAEAQLTAVVFDYDGTLCGPRHRLEGPSSAITDKLIALLKGGLHVGIATGRGKSVRDDLRQRIRSTALRRRVIVAYHNGAEIGTLNELTTPPEESPLAKSLQGLTEQFLAISEVAHCADVTAKGSQITLQLSRRAPTSAVFEAVSRIVRESAPPGVTAVTSTHSIDVLAPGISKRGLLTHLQTKCGIERLESSVLCIGDRGQWPGNDAELLSHPLSLSVDQVSRDPRTCWNLGAPRQRYDLSCLAYLELLVPTTAGMRLDVEGLRR